MRKIRPTVICIDIDRFKQINETIGFSAGDSILLTVARRLGRILKPQDTLARLSRRSIRRPDHFGTETDQIIALANVVRRAVSTPVTFGDKEVPLTASIGLALFDPQLHREARGHAERCRNRDAPWQADRRQPHRSVPAVDAHACARIAWRSRRICAGRSTAAK